MGSRDKNEALVSDRELRSNCVDRKPPLEYIPHSTTPQLPPPAPLPNSASPVLLDKSVSFFLGPWDFFQVPPCSSIWLDVSSQASCSSPPLALPPALPPPLIPLVTSASFLREKLHYVGFCKQTKAPLFFFFLNLFPLTQLGPLWPRKMAISSLLWKFLPPIQFHRRLV